MRTRPVLTLCLIALFSSGCFPRHAGFGASNTNGSHPPASEAEWAASEARSATLATEGGAKVVSVARVVHQGPFASYRFPVRGGHCYRTAGAWAFTSSAAASVMFHPRADGQPVNDALAGQNGRWENGSGVVSVCADRDGEAELSVSAVDPSGAINPSELLEYAIAVGEAAQSPQQRTAQRESEQARAADARATQETNIAVSRQRERQNLEVLCRRCTEDYRLCQVEAARARQSPRPGVTHSKPCEHHFRICATGKFSGTPEEQARCGEPPR